MERRIYGKGPDIVATFSFKEEKLSSVSLTCGKEKGLECVVMGKGPKEAIYEWLAAYCNGEPLPFSLPLNIEGSAFRQLVLKTLLTIPFGMTCSYGQVAKIAGKDGAARAVGTACGSNRFPLLIPCHRVVAARGYLGGFAEGVEVKKRLLSFEGAAGIAFA